MNRYPAVLAMVAAFCQPVFAGDPVQESIDWLLSLKLTDMPRDNEPIVLVITSVSQYDDHSADIDRSLGFLTSDDGVKYRVKFPGGASMKEERGSFEQYHIAAKNEVRRLSGDEAVKFWCERMKANEKPFLNNRVEGMAAPVGEIVSFAATLQRRGEHDAAEKLVSGSRTMFPKAWPKDEDFADEVKKQLSKSLLQSAVADTIDETVPRKLLVERLVQLMQHFAGSEAAKAAEILLPPLKEAVRQDELIAKSGLDDNAIARLPLNERVAALIQRLPDQTGTQMCSWGKCDVFASDLGIHLWMGTGPDHLPQRATTPAGKLYELGWDAVPQLIEAIDDRRPTRAAGRGAQFGNSSGILDVGDCACQILERTADQFFGRASGLGNSEVARAEAKQKAQEWWNSVKSTPEADFLEKRVSTANGKGMPDVNTAAQRLATVAPDRLVAVIEKEFGDGAGFWYADIFLPALVTAKGEAGVRSCAGW